MAEFERLQQLWQQQPEPRPGAADVRSLTREFGLYGRRQNRINASKLVAIIVVLAWSLARGRNSVWALSALGIVATMALLLLWWEWRGQRALARLNFADASVPFVRAAIARLEAQRDPLRKYYWPFVLCTMAALNVVLLGAHSAARGRWWLHIAVTALPFGVYEFGKWIRRGRFNHECAPMLERLRAMLDAMEDRSI
jgi:hypothetical protein